MADMCAHCGRALEREEVGTIWCSTPLGMTTLKTCKTQECGKGALAVRPEWAMLKGNKPPESKAEKSRKHAYEDRERAALSGE